MNNYNLLIERLDAFIRKYYLNQLLRGGLIFAACLLIYLLLIGVGEYYLYFPAWLKIIMISLLLGAGLLALAVWVIIPLLRIRRLGKIISHEEAARIIGTHFPEVSDKLLNVLQLHQQHNNAESKELIEASIGQKAAQISVVPFTQAVDLRKNRKYLPYVLPPALIVLFILVAAPNIFRDAGARLMQPDKNFSPPAPFSFIVLNKDLRVPLNGDYTLEAEIRGDKLPDKVYVLAGDEQLEMQKRGKNRFSYTFSRIHQPLDFRLGAAGYTSQPYRITVIEKPRLDAFRVQVHYPAHTGKKDEELQSLSDMTLPEGTVLTWYLEAQHTDQVTLAFGNGTSRTPLRKNEEGRWFTSARFMQDTSYALFLSNRQIPGGDSFRYQVKVIADAPPQVQAQEMKDSITGQQVLLSGNASDDYGLTQLYFHYTVLDAGKTVRAEKNIPIKRAAGSVTPFQHYMDLGTLNLQPGQQVNYYIEAWDNDAVRGSKSGRSNVYTYSMPDSKQLDSTMSQNARQINQGLSSSAEQAKQLQQDMKEIQNQLLQSESMSWEKQQNMKSLADKQEQLKNKVEAIKKRFEEQRRQSEQKNYSEDIKEKQEAVQKQLDNLLNKQLAEQLRKLQEMMKQMNKDNAFQQLQQMEQQNKLFNMDMERIQELMKKLEMQMKMEDVANRMEDLANRENRLQQDTDGAKKDKNDLNSDQKEIRKDLNKVMQQDMKELDKMNNGQKQPEQLDDVKDKGKEADKNMEQSSDQLESGQQKKASEAQQKAEQNLRQMAADMKKKASGMDAEQIDIDIKATRQILTNLIRFSFDQEQLMNQVKRTQLSSPNYVLNTREQSRLKGNARMIKDSLFTLSKRVFQIAATVNKESSGLEQNIQNTISALENRLVNEASVRQQYAMTNANNLALLLNELLENLIQQQSQAQQSSGNGSCSKPGGKSPKPGKGSAGQMMKDIITGQQELGKGMQQGKGKQDGGQKGGSSPGGKGQGGSGEGGEGEAEEIARMAQQQSALRRQIQELSRMLNSKGMNGSSKELRAIQEQMDKNETDMVNRRLTAELVMRQKEIMSRLLEAEKSIRDQEEDNKRNANSGRDEQRPMPPELQQYLQSRQALLDMYKTVPPALKPYYKKMAEDYLKQVKQGS